MGLFSKKFESNKKAEDNAFLSDVMTDRLPEKEILETRVRWDEWQAEQMQNARMAMNFDSDPAYTVAVNRSAPLAGRSKLNLSLKAKISIVAYLVILLAIIIVVITSANRGLTSVFASTDEDDIAQKAVFSVLSMDEDFYASVPEIDYSATEVTAEYVFVPEKQEKNQNNWFDKLCDFVEDAVGD